MQNVVPTKGNLIAVRRALALAKNGYDLMDRKRNILVREMLALIDNASKIGEQMDTVFKDAYNALQMANISMGICDKIATALPVDNSVSVKYRSVMGVEIPQVEAREEKPALVYPMINSNSQLDVAYTNFLQAKNLVKSLTQTDISVFRLATAVKKTQKRANALKNIIIPGLTAKLKYITDALEEKEREEFSRLKVIKQVKEK